MTEEQKQEERELKQKAVKDLAAIMQTAAEKYKHVFEADGRLLQYLQGVAGNPEKHNLYEFLAAVRFLYLLDKYTWVAAKYKKFVKFYEAVKFSGTTGRTHYKLTPVQCFQFANIYGFVDEQGRRLCRNATLLVARKYAKTTIAASMAVFDMLFGDQNAQAFIGSNSYQQSKICFTEVQNILLSIDPNEKHFVVNREMVRFRNGERESFVRCLTANARTQDGLFASLVIMDEYSQARNTAGKNGADLKNTLTSSMGPRREPLTVVITTASEVVDGPFVHELEGMKAVLRGELENDRVFAAIFQPDVDDDISSPDTWIKTQPHLGVTVQPDFYAEEYKNALLSTENMMVFKTKLLNIFAENEGKAWLSSNLARDISTDFDIFSLEDRPPAMAAIDLSVSDDFSAVTIGVFKKNENKIYLHTVYFFPSGALDTHPNKKLYTDWAAKGYLTLTEGPVIDYRVIADYILRANDFVKILQVGFDQYKSNEFTNILRKAGAGNALKAVGQTYGNFTAPVEMFEHGTKTGHIYINDNPINDFCFSNAVLDYDNLENCKPLKRSHNEKIDGVITMLMCLKLFIDVKY